MAQNYISRGEVITLETDQSYTSGNPYRISGFNGVALLTVSAKETMSFMLEGVFELELVCGDNPENAGVDVGDLIYITPNNEVIRENGGFTSDPELNRKTVFPIFGRAVTASDENNKFYCRLLQTD